MTNKIALDTSFVLGLLDRQDLWHERAEQLKTQLAAYGWQPVVFDCVISEAISTIAHRTHERRRGAETGELLSRLRNEFPAHSIVWVYPDLPRLYESVVDLVEGSSGALNFNDALIALSCRNRKIIYLASFDSDFDQVAWLKRIAESGNLAGQG
ncbi:MAG: type II toxin-antitoxin system VapC family toxin [Anaerolineales bacterium]|nr:type II toxin-antitoxin system VapC family toxin [Anaerolineales bacterium]